MEKLYGKVTDLSDHVKAFRNRKSVDHTQN